MGLVHADFVLTNLFSNKSVPVRALVDTGSTHFCVTSEIARELGFDVEEASRASISLADGRRQRVPVLRPVEVHFGERNGCLDVFVLGDECLVGVLPLEAMDLVIDLQKQQLVTNPAHPDGCYARA